MPSIKVTGPFEQEGPLEWAVLASMPSEQLEERAFRFKNRHVIRSMWDLDAARTWRVVKGTKKFHALIETASGSFAPQEDFTRQLSRECKTSVYVLGFAGYADPDRGLSFIRQYDSGESGLIWMGSSHDGGPSSKTVAGPRGVPNRDPFEFAEALGCKLRSYHHV